MIGFLISCDGLRRICSIDEIIKGVIIRIMTLVNSDELNWLLLISATRKPDLNILSCNRQVEPIGSTYVRRVWLDQIHSFYYICSSHYSLVVR